MKEITRYESNEGSVFLDKDAAIQCDAMETDVKSELFRIADQDGVLKRWIDSQRKDHGKTDEDLIRNTHCSWFSRMLDGSHRPLDKGYYRLQCIDAENREWNQPFFAANPGEGEDVEVTA